MAILGSRLGHVLAFLAFVIAPIDLIIQHYAQVKNWACPDEAEMMMNKPQSPTIIIYMLISCEYGQYHIRSNNRLGFFGHNHVLQIPNRIIMTHDFLALQICLMYEPL